MLRNCSIININQLLFVICESCGSRVTKMGGSRAVVQQRRLHFYELPEFLQRQQGLLELKEQTLQADLNFYCTKCNSHIPCQRTFMVKLNVYCEAQQELLDLIMFDEAACQFFGCNADTFVSMYGDDKNLLQKLEDYLTERKWNIILQYKKKKCTDRIVAMIPLLSELPQESIILHLAKKRAPNTSTQSPLVLDSSLSALF